MKMKKLVTALATAALLVGAPAASFAGEYKIGDLVIDNPQARATPPGAPVSGGYLVIHNNGKEADRLVGGSADFAGKVEIHEMAMDGEVMKMRELENGLEIPAGGEVTLKPGGYHVMFMEMKRNLEAGTTEKVTLRFQKAGDITMDFDVVDPGALKMNMNKNMNMNMNKNAN
ncbi:MAG: copper chaperone PCu(A)C [Oricola sp.]